jgi:hypothetical protein
MSGQIFISYRRDDSSAWARLVKSGLSRQLPSNDIFMDVDTIEAGMDFIVAIEESVGSCQVLLAIIGKRWLNSSDEEGKRRLDNPEDSVRLEIATALKRNIRVIPVLVDGALMPPASALPDDLKLLVRRNALEISHNRFNADFGQLEVTVERILQKADGECKQREEKHRLEADRLERDLDAKKFETCRREAEEQEGREASPRQKEEKELAETERLRPELVGRTDRAELMIEAPDALVEADPDSLARFKERREPLITKSIGPPEPVKTPNEAILHENIQFTTYRPSAIDTHRWYQMVVFTHVDVGTTEMGGEDQSPTEEMEELARQILGSEFPNYHETTSESRISIPRESEITFVPEIKGLKFYPLTRSFLWSKDIRVHPETFAFRAGLESLNKILAGRLSVFLGHILIAEIILNIRVKSQIESIPSSMRAGTTRAYRKIFASYSHDDADIVNATAGFVKTLGDEYLRDVINLRSGENWDSRLLQFIDTADVFQLFWSRNSAKSNFVEREWRHALALKREAFLRPTFWETPMPEPPDSLRAIHFYKLPFFVEKAEEKRSEAQSEKQRRTTQQCKQQGAEAEPIESKRIQADRLEKERPDTGKHQRKKQEPSEAYQQPQRLEKRTLDTVLRAPRRSQSKPKWLLAVALALMTGIAGMWLAVNKERTATLPQSIAGATPAAITPTGTPKRIADGTRMKQAFLAGDNNQILAFLESDLANRSIHFTAQARDLHMKGFKGNPVYEFSLLPEPASLPTGQAAVAKITYRMDDPSFNDPLLKATPADGFRGSYKGWGCLEQVVVLIEYVDPDRSPEIAEFDMCKALDR